MNIATTKPKAAESEATGAPAPALRVAVVGIGWWSDVLADAIKRSGKIEVAACFTRSEEKREAFAAKYGCRAASSYEDILADPSIEAIVNTTPNGVHLETTRAGRRRRQARLPRQADRQHGRRGRERSPGSARRPASCWRSAISGGAKTISAGSSAEIDAGRFGKLVQAECNISRDRLGKIDLTSWRYQAAGMPGGVMLQIGIHYVDVLEMLLGPVKAGVRACRRSSCCPATIPTSRASCWSMTSGAISNLNASYASASEYYMMNVYGKEASAYYDLFNGLRCLQARRGQPARRAGRRERYDPRGARGVRRLRPQRRQARNRRLVGVAQSRGDHGGHPERARGPCGRGRRGHRRRRVSALPFPAP